MNSLIMCEGKTDAILISYVLCKLSGWKINKAPKNFDFKIEERKNQSIYWYTKEDDWLLICGVGGVTEFANFFKTNIESMQLNTNFFSKLVIIVDKDENTNHKIEKDFSENFNNISNKFEHNQWNNNTYIDLFGKLAVIDTLIIIIPADKTGALETVLLNAIAENEYDRLIVEKSIAFIDENRSNVSKYFTQKRLELKAKLGVVFAVLSPEKVFSFIDELLISIPWENYALITDTFKKIIQL